MYSDEHPNRTRSVRFWTRGKRREVILIDGRRPIPTGFQIGPGLDPNKHPVLAAFRQAYVADKTTMLLSMGEAATVPVMGAISKFAGSNQSNLPTELRENIARLSQFYGDTCLGDLAASHTISYSWFCMARRDAKIGCIEFNASVNFEIDLLLQSIIYLKDIYFFPPKLLSRLFGPRPTLCDCNCGTTGPI
jgi:hypothetical protein